MPGVAAAYHRRRRLRIEQLRWNLRKLADLVPVSGTVFSFLLFRGCLPNVAQQEIISEVLAGRPAYSTTILKEGPDSLDYLDDLAGRQEDGEATDVCRELTESDLDSIPRTVTRTRQCLARRHCLLLQSLLETRRLTWSSKCCARRETRTSATLVWLGRTVSNSARVCNCSGRACRVGTWLLSSFGV